jgi:hypothetical protein
MKTVQRYSGFVNMPGTYSHGDGEFVRHTDYSALEKEKEELEKLTRQFAESIMKYQYSYDNIIVAKAKKYLSKEGV